MLSDNVKTDKAGLHGVWKTGSLVVICKKEDTPSFGFIKNDEDGHDVYVSMRVFDNCGVIPVKGQRLRFLERTTNVSPEKRFYTRDIALIRPPNYLVLATVKWFSVQKDYGFLTKDGGRDCYISRKCLDAYGISTADMQKGRRFLIGITGTSCKMVVNEIWPF